MNSRTWSIASFESLLIRKALIGAFFEQRRERRQDQHVGIRGIGEEHRLDQFQRVSQMVSDVFENWLFKIRGSFGYRRLVV